MNINQIAATTPGCVPVPGHKLQLLSTFTVTSTVYLSLKAVRQPMPDCQSRKPCRLPVTGNIASGSVLQNCNRNNLPSRVFVVAAFSGQKHHTTQSCANNKQADKQTYCQKTKGSSLLTGNAMAEGTAQHQVLCCCEKEGLNNQAILVFTPERQKADDLLRPLPPAWNTAAGPFLAEFIVNLSVKKTIWSGKKFRLSGAIEIIFKFFKKIPKVIQNAADSLNKGNCNCSDLALKVSLS